MHNVDSNWLIYWRTCLNFKKLYFVSFFFSSFFWLKVKNVSYKCFFFIEYYFSIKRLSSFLYMQICRDTNSRLNMHQLIVFNKYIRNRIYVYLVLYDLINWTLCVCVWFNTSMIWKQIFTFSFYFYSKFWV